METRQRLRETTGNGYGVVIPYLRGFGSTRFISDKTLRNGQQSVFAVDTIALRAASATICRRKLRMPLPTRS